MHPQVLDTFRDLCRPLAISGRVLEIGVSTSHPALLDMPELKDALSRTGVGLEAGFEGATFTALQADAHDLSGFDSGAFQLVVSNAMLEHDPRFWLTLAEARRLTAPGGWMVFGAPSYGPMGSVPGRRLVGRLARWPLIGKRWRLRRDALAASSLTLGVHRYPEDYYRFSAAAMGEVILGGLVELEVRTILSPPRVIGRGRKPLS